MINMAEGWISCINCNNRFRAFIRFCPICGSKNPFYNRAPPSKNLFRKKADKKAIVFAASIIVVIISIVLLSNVFTKNNGSNVNNDLYIENPKSLEIQTHPNIAVDNSLLQYALYKINEDRAKYNLPPVQLSRNEAAQIHAEDILRTKVISHWTTDGMKPYMRYSIYNGTGYVSQNIAITSISGAGTINPYTEINGSEWQFVNNDTICCNDGHRHNILDKHHTQVSIGIAYNDHFFALVQNFENNYIQFNQPFIQDKTHVQISGRLLPEKNNNIDGIDIYYDKTPTPSVYEQHKNDKSYGPGQAVASVFNPLNFNLWIVYIREHIYSSIGISQNISLIPADKWSIDDQTIDIRFDLSPILKNDGVYNIVTFREDEQKNQFPVTTYSVFVRTNTTSSR
ncbi:MAG TPA: CAP domain-containing protein [Nitrososphaeraceae archaeon]|nr:CAP domain-containing protein [Nitrososphaeraceae archaeon]